MKNSKKKVLVAAVLAGVLLLGAIVSVVLVLAAQQQNISSNIRITYSVDGVGAKVSAKYGSVPASGIVNMSDMTTPDGVSTELNFSVSDTNGGASLTPSGDITLTQTTGTEVVFEYRFENTADTLFTIGMKSTGTAVNIAEYYYVSTEPLATNKYGKIAEPLLNGTATGELVIPKQAMLSTTTPGNVIYIYVKVAVANINKSASYEKNYNWELKQLTTEQVPFDLAIDNGDGSGASSVKVVKGAVVPVMASLPSAPAGKGFAGYYDAQTDGNLIVSKNGIGVKEINTETTLYARYDEESVLDIAGTTMYGISPTANASGVTEINVPATVTEIADGAFENNTTIESVTIGGETAQATGYATGSALKKIGAKAFAGCVNLTEVIFADRINLKTIGAEAFKGCAGLTELIIPEGVTTIEAGALQNLTELTHLVIPSTVTTLPGTNTENAPLKGCQKLQELECNADIILSGGEEPYYPGLELLYGYFVEDNWEFTEYSPLSLTKIVINGGKTINSSAFSYSSLTSITIGNSVTTIGDSAFEYCESLTSITIPDSVTTIGNGAFDSCTSLTEITIPNSVTTIGEYAFYGCTGLTEITIGDSVIIIGERAFYNCTGLTSVTIGDSVTEIGGSAFDGCSSLTTITIPNSVTTIGGSAFYDCSKLTKVNITDLATWCNISFSNSSANPLYYAKNLYIDDVLVTELEMPSLITEIKSYAFYNCTSLTSVTIPDSVTTIGNYAFRDCTSLTSITIPNSVTTIEWSAFESCTSLTSITIPNSVTSIVPNAFYNCRSLVQVRNLSGQKMQGYTAPSYAEIRTDNLPFETTLDIGEKYAIFINGSEKVLLYATDKTITSANDLPSDLTQIAQHAFEYCESLTSITIPDSVIIIGKRAFYNCTGLTSVTIGDSVTEIGSSAFYNCTGLTSVTIGNSVTTIGSYAFSGCTNLSTVTFENTTGWKIYQNSISTTGYAITVTNATTNATNLKNTSSSPTSPSTSAKNWGKWYLKRSA